MVTASDALALRRAQAGIQALAESELAGIMAKIGQLPASRGRDSLLHLAPMLVDAYGASSGTVAADWYDLVRDSEILPRKARYRSTVVVPDRSTEIEVTIRRVVGPLWDDDPDQVLTALRGPLTRYILDAGRTTIVENTNADPQTTGWQRVTRPGACDFCRFLAARGDVYKRQTATFASHNDCNCASVPSWDPNAKEVDVDRYKASERKQKMKDSTRDANTAALREAIADFVG
jgi:hypothetical protein